MAEQEVGRSVERNLIEEQDAWLDEQDRLMNERLAKARAAVLALPRDATFEQKNKVTMDAFLPTADEIFPISPMERYLSRKKK